MSLKDRGLSYQRVILPIGSSKTGSFISSSFMAAVDWVKINDESITATLIRVGTCIDQKLLYNESLEDNNEGKL
jgi:hypothetical protein